MVSYFTIALDISIAFECPNLKFKILKKKQAKETQCVVIQEIRNGLHSSDPDLEDLKKIPEINEFLIGISTHQYYRKYLSDIPRDVYG